MDVAFPRQAVRVLPHTYTLQAVIPAAGSPRTRACPFSPGRTLPAWHRADAVETSRFAKLSK